MEYKKLDGAILINFEDNVATATAYLEAGKVIEIIVNGEVNCIKIRGNIPRGHKFAIKDMQVGSKVFKYGEVVGEATKDIMAGEHVHNHNLKSMRGGV